MSAVLALSSLTPLASALTAHAAVYGDVVVRSANASSLGWATTNSTTGGGRTYVTDSSAPYGYGALQLTTSSATSAKSQLSKSASVRLDSVSALSYSTKRVSGAAVAAPSYQITITGLSSGGGSLNLVYEPYWNGTVDNDAAWQNWNVKAGKFWSSQTKGGLTNGAGGPPLYTIADVLALNPNATITNFGLNIGTYNTDYVVRADGVNFNGTVYDFEPVAPVAPATPTGLGFAEFACGGATKINSISPKWNAVANAVSYNYRATTPAGAYGPVSVGNTTSISGQFASEGVSSFSVQAVSAEGLTSAWSTDCAATYDATAPVVTDNTQAYGVHNGIEGRYEVTLTFNEAVTAEQGWNEVAGSNKTKFKKIYYTAEQVTANFNDLTGNALAYTFTINPVVNNAPVVSFVDPTPAENSYVRGTISAHVTATDDYGMGSYYVRVWKGAFESGIANLVKNDCYSAPGAFLLGLSQDVT